ncbi:SUMF1/EgtB/PvdO family nonheme iron enzyme [Agrobacterium leguminum]|uniref:formylglycine-generating enzyme family protein n=1 Tax=Agrobacterium leguminum TaxID=2792015 RepID=UPI0022B8359B|nr:SUMF1/EgtB/PvdO family nonheme iron enzyme [Agrobacterium leguminum]MCZ7931158.1 SUMF1/EgtB/PvdO family nonheme iron enzyme [Agrobacterium leguminum]
MGIFSYSVFGAIFCLAIGSNWPDVRAAEMVTIRAGGDASSCGRIGGDFAMATSETTNLEYAEFLNTVAAINDPHGLYSPMMETHFWGGISRKGERGNFIYAPKPGYADLPVTFVSWYSAVRYANWMHYGKPLKPAGLGVTEGNASNGAYDTATWLRNRDAQYWLPSCAEWRQAAFFDPAENRQRRYVTGHELPPSGIGPSSANYFDGRWAAPFPHLIPAKDSGTARSASGTLGQAGNVLEWVEDLTGGQRMALGGSLLLPAAALKSEYVDTEYPDVTISSIGFRVASRLVPSPPGFVDLPEVPFKQYDFVRVADKGNPVDPRTGRGRVEYDFDIGKYELSNREYAEFLNAVAREGDAYGLFKIDMQTGVVGGLEKISESGKATYRSKPGWEKRPVTYVSWFDLARMANWLHYGRPAIGRQELGTTEGDAKTGAYDTRAFPAPKASFDSARLPSRNLGARFFIPSDDEWYKAAYYNAEHRRYFKYPTKSDTPPKPASAQMPAGANYTLLDQLGEGMPYFVSEVDAFAASESYYGTRQQGGNVWEWIEDWRSKGEGGCWRCDEWTKGMRGGSFNYTEIGLSAENLDPGAPELGLFVYGARLARLEEGWRPVSPSPVTLILDTLGEQMATLKSRPAYLALTSFLAGVVSLGSAYFAIAYVRRRAAR